jgi:membrane protein
VFAAKLRQQSAKIWQRQRRRHGRLDHLARAITRYSEADGGRLAAAVTYYAFFATFAMALLGFAIFEFAVDNPVVLRSVQEKFAQYLPMLDINALLDARATIGALAFIGLPITGWLWVDALRSSIRRVWHLPEYPGNFLIRLLVDLLVLAGLGVLLVASLAAEFTTTALANRLVQVPGGDLNVERWLLALLGLVLALAVNTLLSMAVLTALPRLRIPLRRLFGPGLLVAAGLELLKTVGRFYVDHTEDNPTYRIVAGSVGLLVSLNVVNQLLLFAATLTATSTVGRVTDLAIRPAHHDDPPDRV